MPRIWAAYSTVSEGGKVVREEDGFKCCHCGGYDTVKPFQVEFEFCSNCMDLKTGDGLVCHRCIGKPCVHFMKKIEADEANCRRELLLWREADNV